MLGDTDKQYKDACMHMFVNVCIYNDLIGRICLTNEANFTLLDRIMMCKWRF